MTSAPPAAEPAPAAPAGDAQLGLPGMPTRLFACTPSRLTTWLDCPRRYRFTYVDRPPPPKGPPWAHNSLGAAVHTALAGWWRLPLRQRTPGAGARLLAEAWLPDGFRDAAHGDRVRARWTDVVTGYLATLDPADEPVGVERVVGTRTAALALSGRVDRLDRRVLADGDGTASDELVVVDYKTGRRPLGPDDARGSMALALYAVAAARVLRLPCRRVELHHLPTGTVAVHEHTADSLDRQVRRAEEIAAEAVAAESATRAEDGAGEAGRHTGQGSEGGAAASDAFPARPGPACGWCDFLRVCAPGRAVAAPREPWAGLADDQDG